MSFFVFAFMILSTFREHKMEIKTYLNSGGTSDEYSFQLDHKI